MSTKEKSLSDWAVHMFREDDGTWLRPATFEAQEWHARTVALEARLEQALRERDWAAEQARRAHTLRLQSESIYPERWYANEERLMLIRERDSYATEACKARREALVWALDHCLTFGLSVAGIERIRAELARLDAEGDE